MNIKNSLIKLIILIIPVIFLEITFIKTFEKILAGDFSSIRTWELGFSVVAPLSTLFFYVLAYLISISVANDVLRNVSLQHENHNEAPLKVLVEDYNMAIEAIIMPLIMLTYRGTLIITLSTGFIMTFPETFTLKRFLIFISFTLFIAIIYLGVRVVARQFSLVQNKRMRLMDEIISERYEKLDTETYSKIAKINFNVFARKLIIGLFAFAAKPLIDFAIVVVVIFVMYNGLGNELDSFAAISVIGYRMAGPAVNLANNINQINFGWGSISNSWRSLLRASIRINKF